MTGYGVLLLQSILLQPDDETACQPILQAGVRNSRLVAPAWEKGFKKCERHNTAVKIKKMLK